MSQYQFHIYIPPTWGAIIYASDLPKYRVLYVYSETYFINVPLPLDQVRTSLDFSASTVSLDTMYMHNFTRTYLTELHQLMSAFYRPLFNKIKFKGKGYYIYKNYRNTITPQFGYSHRLYTYAYFITVKFRSKTSIFVFGFVKADLMKVSFSIKAMRPISIFTGRGVRFSKQIIYKKAGKISSYR